jgi:hypothetical protein
MLNHGDFFDVQVADGLFCLKQSQKMEHTIEHTDLFVGNDKGSFLVFGLDGFNKVAFLP